jgi:perosamine synthetase
MAKKLFVYEPSITDLEKKYVFDCLESGWISSSGEMVTRFGKLFSQYIGTKHAIPLCNGTAALHIALLVYGIGKGDEVICPAFTFAATANAVIHAGAKPVLVDIEKNSLALDSSLVEKAITAKTKAVIVAHLYGIPADVMKLKKICKKHNLILIEDAAESVGATCGNKYVGSIGDIGCFSFYGNKNVTTGEGGMVVTNNKKIAEKVRYFSSHAMKQSKRYWHNEVGYNYRMTSLQAAIGVAQMERVDEILKKKVHISNTYDRLLKAVPNIRLMKDPKYGKYVCWLYTIFVPNIKIRNEMMLYMSKKGIETRKTFYPLSDMPPYKSIEKFPVSKHMAQTGISFPSSPLLSDEDIEYVADAITHFMKMYDRKSQQK